MKSTSATERKNVSQNNKVVPETVVEKPYFKFHNHRIFIQGQPESLYFIAHDRQ